MANLWLFGPVVTRLASGNKQANAMVRTTTAATMIDGGVKDNVVPQSATAIVNFRLLPGDSVAWVIARVKAIIDDERVAVEPTAGAGVEASRVSPDETEGYSLIAAAVRETFGTSVVTPYLLMGGTDARNFERISPNVYRFAPAIVTGTTLSLVHGTNERVGVDNYLAAIGFYRRLVEVAAR